MSDALRLTQIITNLISNAIKFTTEGKIHYEAKLVSPNLLRMTVSDTGIGIPKDKLQTIFEQYEQVKSTLQRKYKGTGLGLAISKKLVEMLNGTIEVKSKVNKGTTFIIHLPVEAAPPEENPDNNIYKKDASFLSDKRILIADDYADNRFVIKETLLLFNKQTQILEAENGLQAIELLERHNADLVVMDLDMPVMNGFDALAEIRKHKKNKHIKIIASTANLITSSETEFTEIGFDGYLPKPFSIEQLFQLMQKMLN
jgi:CheY-like chemotaxis protein